MKAAGGVDVLVVGLKLVGVPDESLVDEGAALELPPTASTSELAGSDGREDDGDDEDDEEAI